MNKRVGCSDNAGEMDRLVAKGLGISVEEYVEALLSKRVKTQHIAKGSMDNGTTLLKTRIIFRYQGRQTFLDLDN
ncbi:MAG: hypothetical protein HQL69_08175 [Magnetococcales bacterium]|nr:hypothetical protein [Magnetococcales bacterium]